MTTLVRFREPFRELAEMSRIVNSLFEGTNGRTNQAWMPTVDVWETEDELVYAFDLPGIPEDQISLEFEDNALTVSAERAREHEVSEDRFYRYERRFGSFSRTIGVPQGTTEDAISADYNDGVLEVHVRKPEQAKPRRIQVGKTGSKAVVEGSSTTR